MLGQLISESHFLNCHSLQFISESVVRGGRGAADQLIPAGTLWSLAVNFLLLLVRRQWLAILRLLTLSQHLFLGARVLLGSLWADALTQRIVQQNHCRLAFILH